MQTKEEKVDLDILLNKLDNPKYMANENYNKSQNKLYISSS